MLGAYRKELEGFCKLSFNMTPFQCCWKPSFQDLINLMEPAHSIMSWHAITRHLETGYRVLWEELCKILPVFSAAKLPVKKLRWCFSQNVDMFILLNTHFGSSYLVKVQLECFGVLVKALLHVLIFWKCNTFIYLCITKILNKKSMMDYYFSRSICKCF